MWLWMTTPPSFSVYWCVSRSKTRGALLLGMSNEDWDTLDDAMADKLVLTDVAFVSDKKKPPHDYELVS